MLGLPAGLIAVRVLASLEVPGRPVELAAVLEDRRQLRQGLLAVAGPGLVGDLLVDLDRIELVGQRESLDAGGQAGDRLLVAERVQRPDAGVLGLPILGGTGKAHARQGLRAELAEQEVRELITGQVEQARIRFHGLRQRPPPALTVVRGPGKVLRQRIVDRLAVGVDGRPGCLIAPQSRSELVVIGKRVERRQALQPPRAPPSRCVRRARANVKK